MAQIPPGPESRGEQDGPLWLAIKRQLYKPEVMLIKRLVGHQLIQQNKLMWDEIWSLRHMLDEFRNRNDQISEGRRQQTDFCDTQHRDLLRRQAQMILEDLRSQANACGHAVEDMVPELRNSQLRSFVLQEDAGYGKARDAVPPATPSTRPSTASTRLSCSTPDLLQNLATLPSLHMGQPLGLDDIDEVAAGIRESLEAEHQWLLATIAEEYQQLELEDQRRANLARSDCEPSTAQLKRFLGRLQDVQASPGLKALTLSSLGESAPAAPAPVVAGGASVRRLQALISLRRQNASQALKPVQEAEKDAQTKGTKGAGYQAPGFLSGITLSLGPGKQEFDPFFGDPI
mmetsp:Transcript_52835/g.109261  ORF Transcript_52835/g.109261 Transcript_52835/m.109261 type:complete len:345 (-) Transcript_52835:172-1206(-)